MSTKPLPILLFVLTQLLSSAGESAECRAGSADDTCDQGDQFSALQKISRVQRTAADPGCKDVEGWVDSVKDTCEDYVKMQWCTPSGDYGPNWRQAWGAFGAYEKDGHDATTACCGCGGGQSEPTPEPTPEPTGSLTISAIGLADDPDNFKAKQQTSEYRVKSDEVVARRCSSFNVLVTHSDAGLLEVKQEVFAAVERPALLLQRLRHPKKDAEEMPEADSPEDAAAKQRSHLQSELAAAPVEPGPRKTDCSNNRGCKKKLKSLTVSREKLDVRCDFASGVPSESIVDRYFCADNTTFCAKYFDDTLQCLKEREPIDRQIQRCNACVYEKKMSRKARKELRSKRMQLKGKQGKQGEQRWQRRQQQQQQRPGSLVEEESVMGELEEASPERVLAKEAAERALQDEERRLAKQRWLEMRDDLFNWQPPPLKSAEELVEVSEHAGEGFWPSTLPLTFRGAGDLSVELSASKDQSGCGTTCSYRIDFPCDMPVGTGKVCFVHADGNLVCGSTMHVVFNPYASADDTYMSPKQFSRTDFDTYLKQETAGIWTGSWHRNGPFRWYINHFDPVVFEATMKMVSMIPLEQRGSAQRVARWLVFLVGGEVLQGRWCSEEGCYDDGTNPSAWTNSTKIYEQWLETGKVVKYAQCWVFAATTLSATRALGFGSRQVSNFNSAHGHPPYNMGVDDFFTYDEDGEPTIVHENHDRRPESIWNFHAWNEVWMKRPDLAEYDADGWQAIDSTPQERSCEKHGDGSQTMCRYMVGPASKHVILEREMKSKGGETKYNATGGGVSYDSMFVFGEVDGDWRGWRPAMLDWTGCIDKCQTDWRGDGYCDPECNNAGCDWDMGDCCAETCEDKAGKHNVTIYRKYMCGSAGYQCKGEEVLGWELFYNNTLHIGRQISTQKTGRSNFILNDITQTYKVKQ